MTTATMTGRPPTEPPPTGTWGLPIAVILTLILAIAKASGHVPGPTLHRDVHLDWSWLMVLAPTIVWFVFSIRIKLS